MNLRVPGPTPLPPAVLAAMAEPMIGHRSDAFRDVMDRLRAPLRAVFGVGEDVLVLTGSGTGGLEAAITNVLSPGDRVLSVSVGSFGDRFASIAEAFRAEVTRVRCAPGTAARPSQVEQALRQAPDTAAVLLTHNETSTGVANDVEALCAAARRACPAALRIVDAVSSVGAMPMRADEWGCDAVVTASQKALMGPPGLALVGVGPRAWEAMERARLPRFYWDLRKAREFAKEGATPATPAVSLVKGLLAGVELLMHDGLDESFKRHYSLAQTAREGLARLGFRLVAEPGCVSPTITAAWLPEGVGAEALVSRLEQRYGLAITTGHQKDRTIRLAHMGWVSRKDIEDALGAIALGLHDLRGGE